MAKKAPKKAAKKKAAKKVPKRRATRSEALNLTLNPEIVKEAARIVGDGNFRYMAAQELGIPLSTFQRWIYEGRREIREFGEGKRDKLTVKADLVFAMEKSEAKAHKRLLADVVGSEDVKAKIWFLERRWNKMYSRNPNAHIDPETLEEEKKSGAQVLAEKLSQLLEAVEE